MANKNDTEDRLGRAVDAGEVRWIMTMEDTVVDINTIKKYEAVEKLCLTDEEREFAINAMNKLEDSFIALSEIDTEGIAPLVSVLDLENVIRDDISVKLISRDELLSNAPEEYNGYYQVPKTLGDS